MELVSLKVSLDLRRVGRQLTLLANHPSCINWSGIFLLFHLLVQTLRYISKIQRVPKSQGTPKVFLCEKKEEV